MPRLHPPSSFRDINAPRPFDIEPPYTHQTATGQQLVTMVREDLITSAVSIVCENARIKTDS